MNIDLLVTLIFLLVLVVYLTQLSIVRLNAFGNFLKKVIGILPITKALEVILKKNKM